MFHGLQEKAEEILSEKTGFLVKEKSKIKVDPICSPNGTKYVVQFKPDR